MRRSIFLKILPFILLSSNLPAQNQNHGPLKTSSDVNARDERGYTPLLYAIQDNNFELVKTLINKGAAINIVPVDGRTPIYIASKHGHTKIAEYLISKGAKADSQGFRDFSGDLKKTWTPLMAAAANNHLETVEMLLKNGASLEYRCSNGSTALVEVARTPYTSMLKLLIDKGGDVNKESDIGNTALIYAAYNGQLENVKLLLEHGADPTVWDDAALEVAEEQGHPEVARLLKNFQFKGASTWRVRWELSDKLNDRCSRTYEESSGLIARGADVNHNRGDRGPIWAMTMAELGNDRMHHLKLLLENGANPNVIGEWTYLQSASYEGNAEVVKLLLEHGADVNLADERGESPLMSAVKNHRVEVIKILLENGADVNVRDEKGATALDYAENDHKDDISEILKKAGAVGRGVLRRPSALIEAIGSKNVERIKFLLEKGVSVDEPDEHGNTPLSHCRLADSNEIQIAKLLINSGADINRGGPLRWAAEYNDPELVSFLLEKGAKPNVANAVNGLTPLMRAAGNGNVQISELLIKAGADLNARNNDGDTALMIAVERENFPMVRFLVGAGSNVDIKNAKGETALSIAVAKKRNDIAMLLKGKIPNNGNARSQTVLPSSSFEKASLTGPYSSTNSPPDAAPNEKPH